MLLGRDNYIVARIGIETTARGGRNSPGGASDMGG